MTTMLKGNREETKKGSKKALVWTEESDRAFEGMKQALLSAVGLHLVDPDRGFVLRTDASDYAIGAVLEQVLDDGGTCRGLLEPSPGGRPETDVDAP